MEHVLVKEEAFPWAIRASLPYQPWMEAHFLPSRQLTSPPKKVPVDFACRPAGEWLQRAVLKVAPPVGAGGTQQSTPVFQPEAHLLVGLKTQLVFSLASSQFVLLALFLSK